MRCFFHDYTLWGPPRIVTDTDVQIHVHQYRACSRCGLVDTRVIPFGVLETPDVAAMETARQVALATVKDQAGDWEGA